MALMSLTINTDYLFTINGILKLIELVLGIICMSLATVYSPIDERIFFLVVTSMYFVVHVLILLNGLISYNGEEGMRKMLFEPMYHGLGFILYFSGSVALLVETTRYVSPLRKNELLAAGGIGVINSVLFAVSTFQAYKEYRYD